MSRILGICIAMLVGTSACTVGPPASYAPITRTPAPLPSGATALTLEVAPLAASGPPPNWACAGATTETLRVVLDGGALAFETDTGERIDLVWPRGFSARLLDGRAEIVAPDGSVIAREGDEIADGTLSGSAAGTQPGSGFDICGVNDVYYTPAS